MEEVFWTPAQAAENLHVSRDTIYSYLKQGLFKHAIKIHGTRWLIPPRLEFPELFEAEGEQDSKSQTSEQMVDAFARAHAFASGGTPSTSIVYETKADAKDALACLESMVEKFEYPIVVTAKDNTVYLIRTDLVA